MTRYLIYINRVLPFYNQSVAKSLFANTSKTVITKATYMSEHANVSVIPSHVSYSYSVQWNHTECVANIYTQNQTLIMLYKPINPKPKSGL